MQIDRNIPIPTRHKGLTPQYDLSLLEVGDSILADQHPNAKTSALSVLILRTQKKTGFRFTRRKQPDGFIRIWRTA